VKNKHSMLKIGIKETIFKMGKNLILMKIKKDTWVANKHM
jgi:hypothetical protein